MTSSSIEICLRRIWLLTLDIPDRFLEEDEMSIVFLWKCFIFFLTNPHLFLAHIGLLLFFSPFFKWVGGGNWKVIVRKMFSYLMIFQNSKWISDIICILMVSLYDAIAAEVKSKYEKITYADLYQVVSFAFCNRSLSIKSFKYKIDKLLQG